MPSFNVLCGVLFRYPHRKWLTAWVLSQNQNCSPDLLAAMWEKYVPVYPYMAVLRNLVRHNSFPIEVVNEEDLRKDQPLLRFYREIREKKSVSSTFPV